MTGMKPVGASATGCDRTPSLPTTRRSSRNPRRQLRPPLGQRALVRARDRDPRHCDVTCDRAAAGRVGSPRAPAGCQKPEDRRSSSTASPRCAEHVARHIEARQGCYRRGGSTTASCSRSLTTAASRRLGYMSRSASTSATVIAIAASAMAAAKRLRTRARSIDARRWGATGARGASCGSPVAGEVGSRRRSGAAMSRMLASASGAGNGRDSPSRWRGKSGARSSSMSRTRSGTPYGAGRQPRAPRAHCEGTSRAARWRRPVLDEFTHPDRRDARPEDRSGRCRPREGWIRRRCTSPSPAAQARRIAGRGLLSVHRAHRGTVG